VDIGLFFDELAPFGEWQNHPDYGWVWSPRVDSEDWRPYTLGRWVWTDEYGWLWSSDEEFGWAVYHYGRWLEDEQMGWVWVPGTEWGPAWVAWRDNDDYIGWAPLPPRAGWNEDYGFRSVADFDTYIPEEQYSFVRVRLFIEPTVYNYILPRSRGESCYRETRNCTDYRPDHDRIVNRSVDVDQVRRVTGHAVPRVRPVDVPTAHAMYGGGVRPGEVTVFRPRVQLRPELVPPTAVRSEDGRAMRTRPSARDNETVDRHDADARERQQTVERQQAAEQQREAERRQQLEPQTQEPPHAVERRSEPGPAAGVPADQIRAIERQQQYDRQRVDDQRLADEQRRAAERQQVEAQRDQQQRQDNEERARFQTQPREERRGPAENSSTSTRASSSSGSSSSSNSSSSANSSGSGHASHDSANNSSSSNNHSSSSSGGHSSSSSSSTSSQSKDKDNATRHDSANAH
jgi:hypothetical protein